MVGFDPALFVEIVGWYKSGGWFVVDLFMYILVFGGITNFALGKVFHKSGKSLVIGLTLALTFSLLFLESQSGINILSLGPFAALMLGLLVMVFVRNLVKEVYDEHHVPLITGIFTGLLIVDGLWSGILTVAPSNPFLASIYFTLQLGTVLFNLAVVIGLFWLVKEGFSIAGAPPSTPASGAASTPGRGTPPDPETPPAGAPPAPRRPSGGPTVPSAPIPTPGASPGAPPTPGPTGGTSAPGGARRVGASSPSIDIPFVSATSTSPPATGPAPAPSTSTSPFDQEACKAKLAELISNINTLLSIPSDTRTPDNVSAINTNIDYINETIRTARATLGDEAGTQLAFSVPGLKSIFERIAAEKEASTPGFFRKAGRRVGKGFRGVAGSAGDLVAWFKKKRPKADTTSATSSATDHDTADPTIRAEIVSLESEILVELSALKTALKKLQEKVLEYLSSVVRSEEATNATILRNSVVNKKNALRKKQYLVKPLFSSFDSAIIKIISLTDAGLSQIQELSERSNKKEFRRVYAQLDEAIQVMAKFLGEHTPVATSPGTVSTSSIPDSSTPSPFDEQEFTENLSALLPQLNILLDISPENRSAEQQRDLEGQKNVIYSLLDSAVGKFKTEHAEALALSVPGFQEVVNKIRAEESARTAASVHPSSTPPPADAPRFTDAFLNLCEEFRDKFGYSTNSLSMLRNNITNIQESTTTVKPELIEDYAYSINNVVIDASASHEKLTKISALAQSLPEAQKNTTLDKIEKYSALCVRIISTIDTFPSEKDIHKHNYTPKDRIWELMKTKINDCLSLITTLKQSVGGLP